MPTPATSPVNFSEVAEAIVARGFSVIPLLPGKKDPDSSLVGKVNGERGTGGAVRRTRDLDIVRAWAAASPNGNVGLCSDENYTLLETDNEQKFRDTLRLMTGHEVPETLQLGSGRPNRCCWIFKRNAHCGAKGVNWPEHFEFRNENEYVAAPGSLHPMGLTYRWLSDTTIAEWPEWLRPALEKMAKAYKGEATSEHVKVGASSLLKNAYLVDLNPEDMFGFTDLAIMSGERHYVALSVAGFLHDGERTAEDIYEILQRLRDEYFADGKSDYELERIAHDVVAKTPYDAEPRSLKSMMVDMVVYRDQEDFEAAQKRSEETKRRRFAVPWKGGLSNKVIEPPKKLITQQSKGGSATVIRSGSISEIFAYRGLGKSAFAVSLAGLLLNGGRLLDFESEGGYRVLLVDGELPESDIQSRVNEFAKPGDRGELMLRYVGMGEDGIIPAKLNTAAEFASFIEEVNYLKPDVIIFDTRTAVFGYDTNNSEQTQDVNDFLTTLRTAGYAVIITHHAGKNGTQRGRTDNDDQLDLIMKLDKRSGWKPGMGLEFSLEFEKVRHSDHLEGFSAKYAMGTWVKDTHNVKDDVLTMLMEGKGRMTISEALGISEAKVRKLKIVLEEEGFKFPEPKNQHAK